MEDENDTLGSKPFGPSSEPGDVHTSNVSPITGFWRRLAAFLIDITILGIAGQILGWSLSSIWFEIGPYGRIVGLVIGVLYFGVMGSGLAGGSTAGKRLLGIAVRGQDGRPIGILRSLLRTAVWVIPLMLNGWALPLMSNPVVARVVTVIVFGVGGAVVLSMVLNRRSGQGLHDVLTHTYVLRVSAPPLAALPTAGRLPWVASAVTLTFAVVLVSIGQLVTRMAPRLQNVLSVQQKLQKDGRFFSVGVSDMTFYESGGKMSRVLQVQVWYKGVPTAATRTRVMNEVAQTALTTGDLEQFDLIRIVVMSAYDLGIASGNVKHGDGQPVREWKARIGRISASHLVDDAGR